MVQTKLFESRGSIVVDSSFSHVWRGSGADYAAVSHVVVAYLEALVLTLSIISVDWQRHCNCVTICRQERICSRLVTVWPRIELVPGRVVSFTP
jgi:hypothetical protein